MAQQTASTPFQTYGGQFVAPINSEQTQGINATNAYANAAQPYYGAATDYTTAGQTQASPYYSAATGQVSNAAGLGAAANADAYNTLDQAQATGSAGLAGAAQTYGGAYQSAQPYNQAATSLTGQALGAAGGLNSAAQSGYGGAYETGAAYNQAAGSGLGSALSSAQPYNSGAAALDVAGTQAVNAQQIGANQINEFESPYIQDVTASQEALLNQQNQQAQSGQLGTAIQSGAFGGDRSGIAAANLQQQEDLANNSILSSSLNSAYSQALGAAQTQQGVNLSAGQANRAAVQTEGQNLASLGNQIYGQGTGTAEDVANLGNQAYTQEAGTAGNLAALGNQEYTQGLGAAGQLSNIGQQEYTQGTGLASGLAGIAGQQYSQGANTAAQQAAIGQQAFGQGITAAGENATLGSDVYNMNETTGQNLANLGTAAQTAGLQGASAEQAAGATQQQTQQAQDTAAYNQFLQQQSYPFQVDQFLANIAEGTGSLSGSTTTQTSPGSILSDERVKENIKPIGKLRDGQTLYRYNYKGDNVTHIGLIAQEVQKKHPEAVTANDNGLMAVNYDLATRDSERTKKAGGGGLAGAMDPGTMAAILQAQAQMYGGYNAGLAGGSPATGGLYGGSGSGRVPSANVPMHELHAPTIAKNENPSVLQQLHSAAQAGDDLGKGWDKLQQAGKSLGLGGAGSGLSVSAPTMSDAQASSFGVNDQVQVDPNQGQDATPSPPQTGYSGADGMARGGLAGYATGGDIDPYGSTEDGPGLDIPEQQSTAKLNPSSISSSGSGGGAGGLLGGLGAAAGAVNDIGTLGKAASAILPFFGIPLKTGGAAMRKGYAGEDGDSSVYPDSVEATGASVADNTPDNGGFTPNDHNKNDEWARTLAAAPPPAKTPQSSPTGRTTPAQHAATRASLNLAGLANPLDLDSLAQGSDSNLPPQGLGAISSTPTPISNPSADMGMNAPAGGLTPPTAPAQPSQPGGISQVAGNIANMAQPVVNGAKDAAGKIWDNAKGYGSGLVKGDKDEWIPLLTGLAAAASAPTRNSLSAALVGLGAGAQSYMPLKEQEAQVGLAGAQTGLAGKQAGLVGAETDTARLEQWYKMHPRPYEGAEIQDGPTIDPSTGKPVANQLIGPKGTPVHWAPSINNSDYAPGGPQGPQGPQSVQGFKVLGTSGMQYAPQATKDWALGSEPTKQRWQNTSGQWAQGASQAQQDNVAIDSQMDAILQNKGTPLQGGALQQAKENIAKLGISLVASLPIDEATKQKLNQYLGQPNVSAAEEARKYASLRGFQTAGNYDQNSVQGLETALAANPNNDQLPETAIHLLSQAKAANLALIDKNTYADELANAGHLPGGRNMMNTDQVTTAYNNDRPALYYENLANKYEKYMQLPANDGSKMTQGQRARAYFSSLSPQDRAVAEKQFDLKSGVTGLARLLAGGV